MLNKLLKKIGLITLREYNERITATEKEFAAKELELEKSAKEVTKLYEKMLDKLELVNKVEVDESDRISVKVTFAAMLANDIEVLQTAGRIVQNEVIKRLQKHFEKQEKGRIILPR